MTNMITTAQMITTVAVRNERPPLLPGHAARRGATFDPILFFITSSYIAHCIAYRIVLDVTTRSGLVLDHVLTACAFPPTALGHAVGRAAAGSTRCSGATLDQPSTSALGLPHKNKNKNKNKNKKKGPPPLIYNNKNYI